MTDSPYARSLENLIDALHDLVRRNRSLTIDIGRATGVPPSQTAVLAVLGRVGQARIASIADELLVDPSVVSRHAAPLEQAGRIERRADPNDGRAALLRLTPSGVEALAQVRAMRRGYLDRVLSDWSEHQVDALTESVTSLAGLLGQYGSGAAAASADAAGVGA